MPKKTLKRQAIINAAIAVFHKQGYQVTTLADIAEHANIPLGNMYYYFRTKEALGLTVIEYHKEWLLQKFRAWDEMISDPVKRLEAFIVMTTDNSEQLAESGCPIGSLIQEFVKHSGILGENSSELFSLIIRYLEAQFVQMGQSENASCHALHLLATVQGGSLITNAFHQPEFILKLGEQLKDWISSLLSSEN